MMKYDYYDYLEAMKSDVLDYIREEVNAGEFSDREDLENKLNDDLFINDSITGNASGSYTFNSYTAKEYVFDNIDLLNEAITEFCEDDVIGEKFLNEEWEWMDVTIRCYLLGQAISEALDDIEEELIFADDEE